MLQRWGIMLQVVDANAGDGALCCRGGALCFKWWGHYALMRMREVGHYASEVGSIMLPCISIMPYLPHSHPPLEA